jgi:hypothetical protein
MPVIGKLIVTSEVLKASEAKIQAATEALDSSKPIEPVIVKEIPTSIPQVLSTDNTTIGLKERKFRKNSKYLQDIVTTNQE